MGSGQALAFGMTEWRLPRFTRNDPIKVKDTLSNGASRVSSKFLNLRASHRVAAVEAFVAGAVADSD